VVRKLRLSSSMSWLLALMAVREPLRWQLPASGCEAVFFPGGDGQWPLVGMRLRTVRALFARGAIKRGADEGRPAGVWDVVPTAAGLAALDRREIGVAQYWNDQRNATHVRKEC
jgi:hypothetical protein